MEETKTKKEIIVKRVSAFKFEVAVSEDYKLHRRESVIQRAPPAVAVQKPKPTSLQELPPPAQGTVLIRYAILHRIIEMLLWKLLGEQRLRQYCGYPDASTCILLGRVVYLSSAASPSPPENHDCKGNTKCFLDCVSRFLEICAPTPDLWRKFGWSKLTEEEIIRKIFEEELSPNIRLEDLMQNESIAHAYKDLQLLLQWEKSGYTAVSWQGERYFSTLLPRGTHFANKTPQIGPNKLPVWMPPISSHLTNKIPHREVLKRWVPQFANPEYYNNWVHRNYRPYNKYFLRGHERRKVEGESGTYTDLTSGQQYKMQYSRDHRL